MKLRGIVLISCILISIVLFIDGIAALMLVSNREYKRADQKFEIARVENAQEDTNENIIEDIGDSISFDGDDAEGITKEKAVNILILGLDEDGDRSDVIVLLNFKPGQPKLNILSIARDTRVYIKKKPIKINSLIGIGGEKLIIEKVESITGLPVNYYITLNFKGFRELIDSLDGVVIDVPFDMNYDDPEQNLHIHLKKGRQLLDGKKAEQFVRYRKGNRSGEGYSDGDIGRIKMQQDFIRELVQQKMKLKYLPKAYDIFFTMKKYMKTNIEIRDLNYHLKKFDNLSFGDIETYSLPGESQYINKLSYFIYDRQKTKNLIQTDFFR